MTSVLATSPRLVGLARAPHAQRESGAEDHPVAGVVVRVLQGERGPWRAAALGDFLGLGCEPAACRLEVLRGELPFLFGVTVHAHFDHRAR